MKKIISFICFIMLWIGLNSCTVYPTDDYIYTRTVYYPSYDIYYKSTPPPPYHHRYYHPKPQHKPKQHYNKPPQPTHKPKPHNSRPHSNRHNKRH